MFSFNSDKYNYWPIYECIKKFYPIGIHKDETSIYYSYPGIKELEALIINNIHNDNNFKSLWETFNLHIQNKTEKPVIGTTYGQAPSFSSYVECETKVENSNTRQKVLHYFVSLIGPFYTVIGQDRNEIDTGEQKYRSTNYLIVSPDNEYKDIFTLLCEEIENHFKSFRFVPFSICKQTIEGLDVRYTDEHLNSIFNALFNNLIDINLQTLGEENYKADNWLKDGYVDNGNQWTVYPFNGTYRS